MPHSIFFTKVGHAIHGTESEGKLGIPVSHGCVRLSRANATTLYALVQQEGVLNTTVTLTGSSQIALARNPRVQPNAVARRDPAPQYAPQSPQYAPQYNAAVDPAPQQMAPRQIAPQMQPRMQPDDGYIYPADGSSDGARYPAPRSSRRLYDARANQQQPQPYQYYDNNGYLVQSAPPGYAPRPYYQPRGFLE
jgi:L,D-transpeptidase catalytic domain